MKRAFDVVASFAALVVLSPLLAVIGIAVKLTSAGPVLFRGRRIGMDGAPFTILKFRTMRHLETPGAGITRGDDPRVTSLGRFLRRTKVDELPQLMNVLRGEMSIVGPRPEDEAYVDLYTSEQRKVLSVRPGLTSSASLAYADEEALLHGDDWHERYVKEIMPAKLRLDLDYVARHSFAGDLMIVLKTIGRVFMSRRDTGTRAARSG